jgi:hypothetical protein
MGQRLIITEQEKLSIEKLYGILNEQTTDMLTVEKVIEVPNTPQVNLFNSLKSNRELFRNGSLQNEVNGQQLKVEKKILLDTNMYKSLGFRPNLTWTCYMGSLKFDVTIIVKDNKYKIICDNFIWNNQGSGCQSPMSMNPISKTRMKGWTMGYAWDIISPAATKYAENFINQMTTSVSNDDF